MPRYNPQYRRRPGEEPRFALGQRKALVAERDYLFSLYQIDVVVSNGQTGRHVLAVPVAIGAVCFTVGLLLLEEDSCKVEAGEIEDIASLASAVQSGFRQFQTFPANELGRFVL